MLRISKGNGSGKKEYTRQHVICFFSALHLKRGFFFQSMNFNRIFKPIAFFLNIEILIENFDVFAIIRFTQSKQIIGNHIPQH